MVCLLSFFKTKVSGLDDDIALLVASPNPPPQAQLADNVGIPRVLAPFSMRMLMAAWYSYAT